MQIAGNYADDSARMDTQSLMHKVLCVTRSVRSYAC